MIYGERVRLVRKLRRKTQKAVAGVAGVKQNAKCCIHHRAEPEDEFQVVFPYFPDIYFL